MKNKSLIPNIAVLLVVALVCVLTGQIYLQQQKDDVLYTENPNITSVIRLSDYNPDLKDTPGDVDIYVFDSGIPGGKALIYGGTHTNEVGSMLNAVTYLENVKCEEGTSTATTARGIRQTALPVFSTFPSASHSPSTRRPARAQ